jgi:hypothetical protein
MIADGRSHMRVRVVGDHLPGRAAILLTVLGFNLLGDGIRDARPARPRPLRRGGTADAAQQGAWWSGRAAELHAQLPQLRRVDVRDQRVPEVAGATAAR